MRTANTPAFSSGRSTNEAMSPAANTSGSFRVCNCGCTRMQPCLSSARPVLCSQAGPPAWVTHMVSSASKVRPSRVCRQPGETSMTSAEVCTSTLRSCSTCANRFRTPGLCVGKIVSPEVSNTNFRSSGLRPKALSSLRKRYCMDSTNSMPPAPAPTTAIVMRPRCTGHWRALSIRANQRWLNCAIGLTGTASDWAPSTWRTWGVEPMLMDNRS